MPDLTLEALQVELRSQLAPIREELARIHIYVNGIPVLGEAISLLQRDVRLMRAAINDMGRTNITAGEVEAMHTDIDRALAQIRELSARLVTLETRLT